MDLRSLRKILWSLVGLAAVVGIGLVIWSEYAREPAANSEAPAFRAEFQLTDHNGAIRTEKDFAGRWMLVFFGFVNCPDVCPTTLSEVAAVMEQLGEDAQAVQPLFISIDPERDTPSALADFVPRFDADIIGLTGTAEQVARTADTFQIYSEKIDQSDAPDGYTMGHSSQLFLFDPSGGYTAFWPYGTPAEQITADLRERLL
ncbi:MAG: SCO family protein [Alphaproteobacteria bacterium]|nr:SCO family protein [Alphaproteobacteria bacterium]MBU0797592.1 SCO family protein [Alphaproteobacteria bacterium]MBU0886620.1 SCO family protein [Alphaproteobacteria bacterium]MBU1812593.1 SCO family protein [Alphaproteobacteria bacterium]